MNPAINSLRRSVLFVIGLWTLTARGPAAVPFGMVDPVFNPSRFATRCYHYRCYSDGRGGLLWTYVDIAPENFAGANDVQVGGLVRTTMDGVLDSSSNVGPNLRETLGVAVETSRIGEPVVAVDAAEPPRLGH